MRVRLQAKSNEPTVAEYHALERGHGYLSFNSSMSSGNNHFIAHVKLEDGRLGSLMIPINVIAPKELPASYGFSGKPPFYRSRFTYTDPSIFGNFDYYNGSTYMNFINSRLAAVENWLQTTEALHEFREMTHCPVNRYFGVPAKP